MLTKIGRKFYEKIKNNNDFWIFVVVCLFNVYNIIIL
jgi:hypothetical protein